MSLVDARAPSIERSPDATALLAEVPLPLEGELELNKAGSRLPYAFAVQNGVFVDADESPVQVHALHGLTLAVYNELRRFTGGDFELNFHTEADFKQALSARYQRGDDQARIAADDLGADIDFAGLLDDLPTNIDLMEAEDDAPVIKLINAILSQAVNERASDIHIETFEENLSVRLRVDGVLQELITPERALGPLLVSRLKVMARLDIAEKRVPQDGRISIRLAGRSIDIRMSTIPSAHGERVVLRLLDKEGGQLELQELHMTEQVLRDFEQGLHTPHGIILVTGPTGSGKTTTLYAGLSHINQPGRNILTIEDPVEYLLAGIGQTQVNDKVGMTFARGLRAILRQDPDVVMVGEIRDLETAEIAVQASLTGHLVLSTLHTNTALGAVTRLQDMGVEPFLLSSSLLGVMAQRLVRTLCHECKVPMTLTAAESELLGLDRGDDRVAYQPVGCRRCKGTGFRGRRGLYELIMIDDTLRGMIHDGVKEQTMEAWCRERAPGMFQDGVEQILAGATSLAEVLRVTRAS
jgi:general secretion pathway protein E